MSIQRLGEMITKSKALPDVRSGVPPHSKYYNGAGVEQFNFPSGTDFLTRRNSATIRYSRQAHRLSMRSNRCLHDRVKVYYSGDPSVPHIVADIRPGYEGNYYEYYGGHSLSELAHEQAITVAESSVGARLRGNKLANDGHELIVQGFERVQPDLTTVSLPNFLIDLEQLKSLNALWRNSISVTKQLAGTYVGYKFGWKPTKSDIQHMFDSYASLAKKLQSFKDTIGVLQTKTRVLETVNEAQSGRFALSGSPYYWCEWRATKTSVVKAHFKYLPRPLQVMGEFHENLLGELETLGVELNPAIVWDAIPFSFIVDWFVNVGDVLNRYRIDTLHLPIDLVDSALSYKERWVLESRVTENPSDHSGGSTAPDPYPAYVSDYDWFDRMYLEPDYGAFRLADLRWKNPTLNQWSLGVALAVLLGNEKSALSSFH